MKFGQALSVFEAALPEELAGPYRATLTKLQEAAPPMPRRPRCTRSWPRARAALAQREVRRRSTTCPAAAGLDRPGAPGGLARRARGRRQDPVPRRGPGPAVSDLNQVSRVARIAGAWVPGIDIKPILDELKARMGEELDYHLEAGQPAALRQGVPRRPDFARARRAGRHASTSSSPSGSTAPRCRGSSPTGTQEQRDVASPRSTWSSCSSARPGPGCCTPTRTPATSGSPPTAGSASSTSARSTGCPHGLPRRWAGCSPTALERRAPRRSRRACGARASSEARRCTRPRGAARLPRAVHRAAARTTSSRSPATWLRGVAAHINDPRRPEYLVGLKLNLPPEYLLIHRVWLGGIGVLCQLGGTVPGCARCVCALPARHRRVTRLPPPLGDPVTCAGHHQAESSLPSMLRRWRRLQRVAGPDVAAVLDAAGPGDPRPAPRRRHPPGRAARRADRRGVGCRVPASGVPRRAAPAQPSARWRPPWRPS